MTTIFVYGTLKRGQPNHPQLCNQGNGQAHFLCGGVTVQSFPLVIAPPHNVPFLLEVPGEGRRVQGELYQVDGAMLDFLDRFEGVPDLYRRRLLEVELLGGGGAKTVQAFAYCATAPPSDWLSLPQHQDYDSDGDHGLKYCPREDR